MTKYRSASSDPYQDRFLDKHVSKEEARQALSKVLKLESSKIEIGDYSEDELPSIDWKITPVFCRIHRIGGDFPTYLEIDIFAGDYDPKTYDFEEKLSESLSCHILAPRSETYRTPFEYILIDGSAPHRLVLVDFEPVGEENHVKILNFLD